MTSAITADSPSLHPALRGGAGLTLRDLVETTPEAVTDGWCRQVASSLLTAVERQHADREPHRIIMPDTVIVHADGAAEVASALDEDEQFQVGAAVDVKAIAAVLHFAITAESPPGAALLPRGLPQFGDDLLSAIDACLHGDRLLRPQTIGGMRELLGLPHESPGLPSEEAPPAPAASAPPVHDAPLSVADELQAAIAGLEAAVGVAETAPHEPKIAAPPISAAPAPVAPAHVAPPARMSRPLLACLAIGLLGAAGFFIYEKGRQAGAQAAAAAAPVAAVSAPAPAPAPVPDPVAAAPASTVDAEPVAEPATLPAPAASAAPASVTYKLSIKPWGEIYVDGVKRGISPPLKTLTLSGVHTIRIDNPDFPSRTIDVGKNTISRIDHVFQ